jgi:hypothetical protein
VGGAEGAWDAWRETPRRLHPRASVWPSAGMGGIVNTLAEADSTFLRSDVDAVVLRDRVAVK